jgi:hypothetical protein
VEIKEGWVVVLVIVVFVAALCMGFDLGRSSDVDECNNFGKFVHGEKNFTCSAVQHGAEPK